MFTFDQLSLVSIRYIEVDVLKLSGANQVAPYPALLRVLPTRRSMMAPEKGPNRLNMKFTNSGTKLVIHLVRVRGLPPKLCKDKKTITITFPEIPRVRNKGAKP